jgi:hypothetical protein
VWKDVPNQNMCLLSDEFNQKPAEDKDPCLEPLPSTSLQKKPVAAMTTTMTMTTMISNPSERY